MLISKLLKKDAFDGIFRFIAGKCKVIWRVLISAHRELRDPERAKFIRKFASTKPFMPELRFETLLMKLAVESSFDI